MLWIALVRGINVGGRAKVAMADLKARCEKAGCNDVRTYIQSGNVLFESSLRSGAAVEDALRSQLAELVGRDVRVMVRTPAQLQAVLDANPFDDGQRAATTLHVLFLEVKPKVAAFRALDLTRFEPDQAALVGSEVYLHFPDGSGRAKLNTAMLEKALGTPGTARNLNTVRKLVELSQNA